MQPRHLYVHVPFCARRCAYCDFSIAVRRRIPVEEYLDALSRELSLRFSGDGLWPLDTLYLGGGTPSRLGGDGIAAVLRLIGRFARLAADTEVTLEANPDDLSLTALERWREAGVNRLSLGVQSFHDEVLAWMRRTHDAHQARDGVRKAREVGIHNVSIDLIFALPPQVARSWAADLEGALSLEPSHVSLYGLTAEPRTPFGRWVTRGAVAEAPEDTYAEEFLAAHERLESAGYVHYEVSNYALPGFESRHNASYWDGVPYAGIGPAAHEFDGVRRRWNTAYAAWLARLRAGEDPRESAELLSDENRAVEEVYLGLRTSRGVAMREGESSVVGPWLQHGWAERRGERVGLTATGWLRLDTLALSLTTYRSRY